MTAPGRGEPVDPALVESIRRARAEGWTLEAMYLDLLQRGFTVSEIQAHVAAATEHEPDSGARAAPEAGLARARGGGATTPAPPVHSHRAEGPAGPGGAVPEPSGPHALDHDATAREATGTRAARLLLLAAAAFVAAGIFSFVAANWDAMPRPLRLTLVLAVMLAANVSGWLLQARRHERLGESLLVLGTLVYGAGILLVGQMFNVRATWPDGFVLWCLGAVAMAHAVGVRLLFGIGLVMGAVALVGSPVSRTGPFRSASFALTEPALMLAAAVVAGVTGIVLVTRGRRGRGAG